MEMKRILPLSSSVVVLVVLAAVLTTVVPAPPAKATWGCSSLYQTTSHSGVGSTCDQAKSDLYAQVSAETWCDPLYGGTCYELFVITSSGGANCYLNGQGQYQADGFLQFRCTECGTGPCL